MALFDISVPSDTIRLAGRRADVAFSVHNTGDREVNGRAYFAKLPPSAQPQPQKQAPDGWLSAVDAERKFAPGQTHQFVVRVDVPADGAAGGYAFRLAVCDVERPDDEFTEGPPVAFEVATAAPPPKDWRWLWWAVGAAAAVALLVVGLLIWRPWQRAPVLAIPDLTNKPLDEARRQLEPGKYAVVVADLPEADRGQIPADLKLVIRGQKTAAGSAPPAGSAVEVTVWRAVTWPVGKGVDFDKDDDPLVDPAAAGVDVTLTPVPDASRGPRGGRFDLVGGARCAVVQVPGNGGPGAAAARFGFVTGASGIALVPGGKVVAVGQTLDLFQSVLRGDVIVARYLPDGRVDPDFARSGRVAPGWAAVGFEPPSGSHTVAAGPDGRAYVAGTVGDDLSVVCLGPDGELDRSFNGSGIVKAAFGVNASIAGLAVDATAGRVLVVGWSGAAAENKVLAAAFQLNGRPDPNFGTDGKSQVAIPGFERVAGGGPVLQADGTAVIVVELARAAGGPQEFGLVRLTPRGAWAAPAGPGPARFNFGGTTDGVDAVADGGGGGRILVAGTTQAKVGDELDPRFAVARFLSDLGLDRGFGENGRVLVAGKDPATGAPFTGVDVDSVAVTRGGGVVVGGSGTWKAAEPAGGGAGGAAGGAATRPADSGNPNRQSLAVFRLTAAGRLDGGFNGTGMASVPTFASGFNLAGVVAVDDADRTISGGMVAGGMCVARFLPDGRLDPSFGGPLRLRELWDGRADPELFVTTFPFGGAPAGTTVLIRTAAGRSVLVRLDETLDPAASAVKFSYMAWTR